jgi:hypothetical protein
MGFTVRGVPNGGAGTQVPTVISSSNIPTYSFIALNKGTRRAMRGREFWIPVKALAQGETTSAIVGQVRDATNAIVPRRHCDDHKLGERAETQR